MTKNIRHFLAALETKLLGTNSACFPLARHRSRLGSVASRVTWIGCVVASLLCAAIPAWAQIRSAAITGTVTDSTGAVVTNADIKITDTATNVSYPTKSNDVGLYTVPYLQPGVYSVSITKAGFQTFTENNVHLDPAQKVRVDVKLTVGATSSVVEVSASAVQLDTEDATISGIMPAAVIDMLPNPTNNPFNYENLQPGVSPSSQSTTSVSSFGIGTGGRSSDANFGVNGGQGLENSVMLDGLPVMGDGNNDPTIIPNLEGIQSVQVLTNSFSAEYGHGAGIANITTKPGTNQFHGLVSYENRNEALMANTAGNKMQGLPRPAFKVDDIGGAVGGPIRKDHIFFDSSFHWLTHNYGSQELLTVPTDLERKGDFGESVINGANGQPTPVNLFDPFSVTAINSNLYQRAEFPKSTNCGSYGCGDVIPNPSPYGLKILSYYPMPNHAPIDPENHQNYQTTVINTVRLYTNNNRIDYKRGRHSIYGTGGFDWGTINNPVYFGAGAAKGFNDVGAITFDRNIYAQIGDTIVFSPTLIMDLRYGAVRDHTGSPGGNTSGFTSADYAALGINSSIEPLFALPGAVPNVTPGSWSNLTPYNQFRNKQEYQIEHAGNFSVTKIKGNWTFKAGAQFQIMLANFTDFEENTANLGGCCASDVGGYTTEYIQADGHSAGSSFNKLPQQNGFAGALTLVNEGVWFVRPGANLKPAYAAKYFAFYTQNDWKATRKLVLNLGLRWELQPGVEERYNRAAMYDLSATSAFGTQGAIAFPGTTSTDGHTYGHAMWPTELGNVTPHLGFAYRLRPNLVARGGFGGTYLPSNSGYFSSPNDYGEATWASGNTGSLTYGSNPAGIPTEVITDAPPVIQATLNDYKAPQTYGVNEAYFPVNMKNAIQMQYNFALELSFGANSQWLLSAAEAGSRENHLFTRNLPFQNIQTLSASHPELLSAWRQTWIDSNGKTQPQTQQVPNPYQPTSGPLLKFQNALAGATIQQFIPYLPYPLLYGTASNIDGDLGFGSYDSLQVTLAHHSSALYLNANYTWSKNLAFEQSIVAGGNISNGLDLLCNRCNRNYTATDVPNRFVATAVYQLPFNQGQRWAPSNRVARGVLGGWSISPVVVFNGGTPITLGGLSGQFTGRINYAGGRKGAVPLELPKSYQHWYNGVTKVTLPCGIQVTPSNFTRLKYNACAFSGPTVTTPDGTILADEYWYGNGNQTNGDIRGPSRADVATSVRKTFNLTERYKLDFTAAITNVLNMAEWNGNENGGIGGTDVVDNPAKGQIPGLPQGGSYGQRNNSTYDPRQVELIGRIIF